MATPGDYATNLSLWLKADALTGLSDGDPVSTWENSSNPGTGDATASSSARPTYKTGILNGLPVLRFAGAQQMGSVAPTWAASQTVVAVVKSTNLTGVNTIRGGTLFAGSTGGLQFRIESAANPAYLRFVKEGVADIGSGNVAVTASTWHVVTGTWDDASNSYAFTIDGAAAGSGTSSETLTNFRATTIGANGSGGGGPSEFFVGDIAELAQWETVLDSTDLGSVVSGLMSKYGIGSNLASGTATAPTPTATGAGTVATPATGTATAPTPTATGAGTSTVTGAGTATAPTPTATGVGTSDDASYGTGTATAPTPTATGAGTSTVTGTGTATAPAPTATGAGTSGTDPIGTGTATAPVPTATGTGTSDVEDLVTVWDEIAVDAQVFVTLTPAAELPGSASILRESYLMPPLTEADPVYQARVDYDVIREEIGTVHLWVGGVDVTYFRGVPSKILRWDSEAPFGDKAAAWEMPQMEPWERPGVGDFAFMRKDAEVVIGYVSPLGVVRREWEGFLDSRTRNLGDARSSVFEAKGEMWAALHHIHEPLPYMAPTDIGIVIPRLLNNVPGRRYPRIPEVITGFKTRTRGNRDQWTWQVAQDIFAEAWTDDGRQWTLRKVNGAPRLVLKTAMDDVAATVAWGTPLVDIDLTVDESSRVDVVWARGKSPGGGEWANVFYPGLSLLTPPPFPIDPVVNINVGMDDADTDTGTGVSDWQRKVNALGRWGTLSVDGTFSTSDSRVLREIQDDLGLTVDGSLGPQSWEGTFGAGRESIDLTPLRLPLVMKPTAWKTLHDSHGRVIGLNPNYDPTIVQRAIPLDLGTNITRAQGRKVCKTYLAIHGEASAAGSVEFIGDPNNIDRTRLQVGDNLTITGLEGQPVTVQLASKSCEFDGDNDGRQLIVRFQFDERARDALTVDQILDRNRAALPDPARRPGNPNRSSRNVVDEGYTWDEESPCGILDRVAVNGASGLWTIRTVPAAEFGALASIILEADHPFAFAVFANTRITPNVLRRIVGNPFASSNPFRPHLVELENTWGFIEAWGSDGDACGFSPLRETEEGATFTGDFVFKNTLEYVTGTEGPYLSFAFYFRDGSGFVDGRARQAKTTA